MHYMQKNWAINTNKNEREHKPIKERTQKMKISDVGQVNQCRRECKCSICKLARKTDDAKIGNNAEIACNKWTIPLLN